MLKFIRVDRKPTRIAVVVKTVLDPGKFQKPFFIGLPASKRLGPLVKIRAIHAKTAICKIHIGKIRFQHILGNDAKPGILVGILVDKPLYGSVHVLDATRIIRNLPLQLLHLVLDARQFFDIHVLRTEGYFKGILRFGRKYFGCRARLVFLIIIVPIRAFNGIHKPFAHNIIHLTTDHTLVRPGHLAVDGRDARKDIRLDDCGRIGRRIGGVLKHHLLFHRLPDGKHAGARHVHHHEKRQRDHQDGAVLARAFLHCEQRKADKSGCISFRGEKYDLGVRFAGRKVDIIFDESSTDSLTVEADGVTPFRAHKLVVGEHVAPRPKRAEVETVPTDRSRLLDAASDRYENRKMKHRNVLSYTQEVGKADGEDV